MRVLCLRDQERGAPQDSSLSSARVFFLPVTRINRKRADFPKKEFDYCLITSANALRFSQKLPHATEFVFIGKESYRMTADRFPQLRGKSKILEKSDRRGVQQFFKRKKEKSSIFFPRSAQADQFLPQALRALGHSVCVRLTYETSLLRLGRSFEQSIKANGISALYFTSPSGVQAVFKAFSKNDLENLGVKKFMAIGPTTKEALNRHLR